MLVCKQGVGTTSEEALINLIIDNVEYIFDVVTPQLSDILGLLYFQVDLHDIISAYMRLTH
jgi:hypothetical protein